MSITVIISRDDNGAPTTREVYAEGVKFSDEGGNLSIISGRPQLIALYGSGNWLSVHVDDYVEVKTEKPAEDDDSSSFDFGSDDSDSSSFDMDSSDTDADTDSESDSDADSVDTDADSTDTDAAE